MAQFFRSNTVTDFTVRGQATKETTHSIEDSKMHVRTEPTHGSVMDDTSPTLFLFLEAVASQGRGSMPGGLARQ